VLARHRGTAVGAEAVASAADRAYTELAAASAQLIGEAGIDALTGRAVNLAQNQFPWLLQRREPGQAQGLFAPVVACLKDQDPSMAAEAAAVILATLAGLLITFIGDSLTTQLLQKAWPEAFSTASDSEEEDTA
jgi:hypothetical protein